MLLIKDYRDAIFHFVNIAQGEKFVKLSVWPAPILEVDKIKDLQYREAVDNK
jgi:hypothetical protein